MNALLGIIIKIIMSLSEAKMASDDQPFRRLNEAEIYSNLNVSIEERISGEVSE